MEKLVAEFIPADEVDDTTQGEVTESVVASSDWRTTLTTLANKPGTSVRLPRTPNLKREQVVNAFLDSFELIGGVTELSVWGAENRTEFYKLWAKLAPKQVEAEMTHDGGIRIQHVLPRGPLDE